MSDKLLKKAELALTDFSYFIEEFLDMKLWGCQRRWADDVQTVIDSDVYHGLQLLAPADHGKSSRIVVSLPLWLWARDRTNRIILAGNTDDYITQIGRAIKTRIERSPKIEKAFGIRRGIKWADNEIHIDRPNWEDKDPSLLCVGVGAEIQSQRADYILGDDMFTRRNSRTESMRAALNSYVETDLGSRLDKTKRMFGKGKTIYMGHRVDPNDGYRNNEGRPDWLYKTYPAILDDTKQDILCPEAHSYADLAGHRSRDPVGFGLMYQQQSISLGMFVTQTAMEQVRVPQLRFVQSMTPSVRSEFTFTWMSLDPAFSKKRWASHAVWNLWGMLPGGKRRLLWAFRDRVSPDQLLNVTELKFRLFMPDHFLIETNQGQVLLLPFMKRKFPDHASKFKAVYTHDNDHELESDITKIFSLYSAEPPNVEIPYHGVTEQSYAHVMMEEYCGYPNFGRRDTLMAQYIGEKGLGLIKDEARKGYVPDNKGIMGTIASRYRGTFGQRRWW